MPNFEGWLLMLLIPGLLLGAWGIRWERASHELERPAWLGRGLFLGALVFLGIVSVVAAFHRADGLVPLGLTAGFLLVGMLWGDPRSTLQTTEESL
jgi:hypothetical protein